MRYPGNLIPVSFEKNLLPKVQVHVVCEKGPIGCPMGNRVGRGSHPSV